MPPSVRNSAPVTKPLSGPTSQAAIAAVEGGATDNERIRRVVAEARIIEAG